MEGGATLTQWQVELFNVIPLQPNSIRPSGLAAKARWAHERLSIVRRNYCLKVFRLKVSESFKLTPTVLLVDLFVVHLMFDSLRDLGRFVITRCFGKQPSNQLCVCGRKIDLSISNQNRTEGLALWSKEQRKPVANQVTDVTWRDTWSSVDSALRILQSFSWQIT